MKAFVDEYQHYLINMRVRAERQRARKFDWRYAIAFMLENSGTAAAEDVEVMLAFPAGCFVVGLEDEYSEYDGFGELDWSPPVPDWKQPVEYRVMAATIRAEHSYEPWSISYPDHHEREAVPTGPQYYDDRSRVSYQHPKLRPLGRWPMPPVAVCLPPQRAAGFGIRYTIQADAISKPIEGELHVRLDSGDRQPKVGVGRESRSEDDDPPTGALRVPSDGATGGKP